MILLTRLNNRPITVNADQIKTVEETPDTLITLMNGDQVLVREAMSEVVRKAIDYYRELRTFDMPAGRAAVGHAP
ncbi:MAG: flagellar FlbD family protein [Phycisphaerales bacterium]|nr:MAG: flagellar FlbD family protein [Phycisphaerales bacterium]